MKKIGACKRLDDEFEKAKKLVGKTPIFTPARAANEKKLTAARRALHTCIKTNSGNGGILYSKGLAQAAADAGVKFGLQPDFQKGKGLFKGGDIARKHFKVKKNEEIMPLAKKFAKKHALEEAAQHASAVYALKDALLGTQVGFITAQVGLIVVDAVASVVTVGGYAAAAPFIHAGVGAAQSISVTAINSVIAGTWGDLVVSGFAADDVVPTATIDLVITRTTSDDFAQLTAHDKVICRKSLNGSGIGKPKIFLF